VATDDASLLHRSRTITEEKTERAERAVAAFRALLPTLTTYARMMTRKQDVQVRMSATDAGSTDGKVINLRPPMALGDPTPHVRKLCDRRDEHFLPACPACAAREEVLITIYHEIGHICEDSNRPVSESDRKQMVSGWLRDNPAPYAARVRRHLEDKRTFGIGYLELANLINPYLPHMVNCLEDSRVNRAMVSARPGMRVMFEADSWKIFNLGYEAKNPSTGEVETLSWKANPIESQLMVGLFLMGCEFDFSTWLHEDAVAVLADEELVRIVKRIKTARSVQATFDIATACLARFIELGYFRTPEDEEDLSEEENEDDESEEQPDEQESDGDSDPDESESGSDDGPSSPGEGDAETEASDDSSSDTGGPNESENATEPGEGAGADDAPDDSPESDEPSESDTTDPGASSSSEPGDEAGGGADEDLDVPREEGGNSGDDLGDEQPGDDSESESDDGSGSGGSSSEAADDEIQEGVEDGERRDSGEAPGQGDAGDPGQEDEGGSREDSGLELQSESSDEAPSAGGADQGTAGGDESGEQADADHPSEDGQEEVDDLIDTGADTGDGGIEIAEGGSPEAAGEALAQWLGHSEDKKPQPEDPEEDQLAVDRAIIQGVYFETPSKNIFGVREHFWDKPIIWPDGDINMSVAWSHWHIKNFRKKLKITLTNKAMGIEGDFDPDETLISGALMHTRITFAENKRGHYERNKKSGKINSRVLGKRAPVGDPHLFKQKRVPGKRSYFVLLGVDISFSQVGENIVITKAAAMAQAELLHRAGIPFAMYAHTGNWQNPYSTEEGMTVDIYHIKDPNEPWTEATRERLRTLAPASANLDGHSLEFYRKRLDEQQATDKIIMYYTDGKMPAENHDEELGILQREIATCKRRGYTLMGVGVRTDSPIKHGLDTVQLDAVEDTVKVVKHLEKRLLEGR
jgi:hypothetical protein